MIDHDRLERDATSEELPQDSPEPAPPETGALGRAIDALGLPVAVLFLLSAAIILYEVVMRYAFNAPTIWAHETTTFLSAVGFIYGGAYCLARDKHIRVVLIYDAVSPRMRRILDIVISLVGLVSACFLAYAAWTVVQRAIFEPSGGFRMERSGSAWNPPFPAILKVFLFVILVVIAAQFLVLAVNYARRNTRAGRRDA